MLADGLHFLRPWGAFALTVVTSLETAVGAKGPLWADCL